MEKSEHRRRSHHGHHRESRRSDREHKNRRQSPLPKRRTHHENFQDSRENKRKGEFSNKGIKNRKESSPKYKQNITSDQPAEKRPEIRPNFELTGALARDTNTFNGIVIKYNQPPEAKKPTKHWRLYPFKGSESLDFIPIHNNSAYLLGRERKVADIPIDHPSCSKQHAVIQFRSIPYERSDGTTGKATRPYIIDLESANGTFVNYKKIDPRRFVELFERDVIQFGFSTREYVLLHEHSSLENTNTKEINSENLIN